MTTLSWGVLGASYFAIEHMIPALQQAAGVRVHGIASRELAKAEAVAEQFDLAQAYGDYESLLADPAIDVVYNPLPNHLHVPWTVKAARAGKHVLCEKPIALDAAEAASLIPVRDETGLQIQEAYVVLHHPQWQRVRALVREGRIGRLRAIQGWFSYRLEDPENIRNKREMGGGGLLDIGVYPLLTGRYVFDAEPVRVFAAIERHPTWDVDVLTSAVLAFPDGILNFTCSTLLAGHQHMVVHGDEGRIELPDPFAQSPSREAQIAESTVRARSGSPSTRRSRRWRRSISTCRRPRRSARPCGARRRRPSRWKSRSRCCASSTRSRARARAAGGRRSAAEHWMLRAARAAITGRIRPGRG